MSEAPQAHIRKLEDMAFCADAQAVDPAAAEDRPTAQQPAPASVGAPASLNSTYFQLLP